MTIKSMRQRRLLCHARTRAVSRRQPPNTCSASAFTTTAPRARASAAASADLPLAVGPAISTGPGGTLSSNSAKADFISDTNIPGSGAARPIGLSRTIGRRFRRPLIPPRFCDIQTHRPKPPPQDCAMTEPKTTMSRVMLKISGEALMGDRGYGLDPQDGGTHRGRGEVGPRSGGGNLHGDRRRQTSFAGCKAAHKGWSARQLITWGCWPP